MGTPLTVAEMRAKIAAGEIKRNTGGGGVGEGNFDVMLDTVEFANGENGNLRGKIACRVVGAVDLANIGKKFNIYLQTVKADYLPEMIAEYSEYCKIWGIPEERLYDRAEDMVDVVGNICTEMQRMAIKGKLAASVERKDSGKLNPKGKKQYWNDILEVRLVGDAAPVAPVAAPIAAPVVTAPVAAPIVAPAPVAAPATPAAPAPVPAASGKPWRK